MYDNNKIPITDEDQIQVCLFKAEGAVCMVYLVVGLVQ
jgi:hypothetical protein